MRVLKYPLDLTGVNPNNRVEDEIHRTGPQNRRAFVLNYGPFFTESLIVKDMLGNVLIPHVDYLVLHPYSRAQEKTGKEVANVIYVHNRDLADPSIMVTAQYIGGEMNWSATTLQELLDQIVIDDREVLWGDIIGKPEVFDPAPHMHDIGDTYGWEYIGYQLEALRLAILQGDEHSHLDILNKIRLLAETVQANENRLIRHVDDKDNPHETTKDHVGLGNLINHEYATLDDVLSPPTDGTDRHITLKLLITALYEYIINDFERHLLDTDNPHNVTKVHVGLGNLINMVQTTDAQAVQIAAVSTNDPLFETLEYVSGRSLNRALRVYHSDYMMPHMRDRQNPHGVSKAQVGLSKVDDFATATIAEAQTGVSNELFLTPAGAKALALKIFTEMGGAGSGSGGGTNPAYTAHLADTNNPHSVTAQQIGAATAADITQAFRSYFGTTGVLPLSKGGTGVTTSAAFANLVETTTGLKSMGKRDVFISQYEPTASSGAVGDIWLQWR